MPLTVPAIKAFKPSEKNYRQFDGKGLYLEITPSGGKHWRLKYRFGGKEKRLTMGSYPEVGLQSARDRRDAARKLLSEGIDPSEQRKSDEAERLLRASNNLESVFREWFDKKTVTWVPAYAKRLFRSFERDIFPALGKKPVADIKPAELLAVLRKVELRTVGTSHRLLQDCGSVWRYAIATGRAERDIAADLRGALAPVVKTHHAAITEPSEVAGLLRAIDGYQGTAVVQSALKLAPLLFVRPGELRAMEWQDVDLDKAEWRYLVTKTSVDQIVPLCTQAVAILRALQPLTGSGHYVFPGARSNGRCMSENTVTAALRVMGYSSDEMSGHGFRAMARTILDEVLGFRPDFIETQLSHAVRDANGRSYNRTSHLPARKAMMQGWADYLDGLKAGAEIV